MNLRLLLCVLLWSVLLAVLLQRHVFACYVIYGHSMSPTINDGDTVFVDLLGSRLGTLERGAIVLVDDGFPETATKRIVGLPGETIEIRRGRVYVNGKRLYEPYLPRYMATLSARREFRLHDDEFFVMGDNRYESYDSRRYGPVTRQAIRGCVATAGAW